MKQRTNDSITATSERLSLVRLAWISFGLVSLTLGIIGIFLPLLPTTPFVLLAAFAFGRGSKRLHDWLTQHPRFGPPIEAWRREGAISPRAKRLALAMMLAVLFLSLAMSVPTHAIAIQAVVLGAVAVFILTRPNPKVE